MPENAVAHVAQVRAARPEVRIRCRRGTPRSAPPWPPARRGRRACPLRCAAQRRGRQHLVFQHGDLELQDRLQPRRRGWPRPAARSSARAAASAACRLARLGVRVGWRPRARSTASRSSTRRPRASPGDAGRAGELERLTPHASVPRSRSAPGGSAPPRASCASSPSASKNSVALPGVFMAITRAMLLASVHGPPSAAPTRTCATEALGELGELHAGSRVQTRRVHQHHGAGRFVIGLHVHDLLPGSNACVISGRAPRPCAAPLPGRSRRRPRWPP